MGPARCTLLPRASGEKHAAERSLFNFSRASFPCRILSTVPGNDTAYYSGTSMAAPLVAGTAALAQMAAGGTLSAKELRDLIVRTAEPLLSLQGKVASGGILRTDKAVEAAAALRVPAPGPKPSRKMLAV